MRIPNCEWKIANSLAFMCIRNIYADPRAASDFLIFSFSFSPPTSLHFIIWWIADSFHISYNLMCSFFPSLWQHFFGFIFSLIFLLFFFSPHYYSMVILITEHVEYEKQWTVNRIVSDNKSSLPFHFHWIIIIIPPKSIPERQFYELFLLFLLFFRYIIHFAPFQSTIKDRRCANIIYSISFIV